MPEEDIFEMRGVKGKDDKNYSQWIQVRDDEAGVRLATGSCVCIISAKAARRLADNLLELASKADGRAN